MNHAFYKTADLLPVSDFTKINKCNLTIPNKLLVQIVSGTDRCHK